MNNNRGSQAPPRPPPGATTAAATQQQQALLHQQRQRIQQHRQQLLQQLQQRKDEYISGYDLPLNYPAKVLAGSIDDTADDGKSDGRGSSSSHGTSSGSGSQAAALRSSSDFINARLLEAGLPLGSNKDGSGSVASTSSSSLADHSASIGRFIRDLEGTGCYDAVQVRLNPSAAAASASSGTDDHGSSAQQQQHQQHPSSSGYDAVIHLREKKWYKLYIGGGVNSDDLSSLGGNATSGASSSSSGGSDSLGLGAVGLSSLPKLQFETSASLLNLTGFADVSSASYVVDQTGSASFRFVHDRPLASYLNKGGALHEWLMPRDPRILADDGNNESNDDDDDDEQHRIYARDDAQYALGGGSHASLGLHAAFREIDYEATRSSKDFVRSVGVRLANHSRGGGGGGGYKPSASPPESMAGPYLFVDWSASLKDALPGRSSARPFALDCSSEVAERCGTYFKHSLMGGLYLNGCFVDDRYDPTMGYDAHFLGEVAGPPGDVGYWKVKGGYSWHVPVELLSMMVLGVDHDSDGYYNDTGRENDDDGDSSLSSVIGMALHSSFNCGLIRPLTFNGLLGNHHHRDANHSIPSSDRFYVGGPGQLRGFLPSGIGPRSNKGGSGVPGGDALGGDLFYTSTLATSIPFPSYCSALRQNGARIFGIANAGTCVSTNCLFGSSRNN